MTRFYVEFFLSHSTKKSLLQHFGVGKLRASKKLFAKGGSRFSVDNFLSHSTEKYCRNNSVYRKTSGIEKTFCKGGSLFSIDNFWSHRTEKLRKGTLVFQKIFDILKISKDRRGVGYHDFVDFFCLTLPKNFVEEQFCVSQSGIQKFYGKEGGGREYHIFLSKIFGLSAEKFGMGTLSCVTNFGCRKNLCFRGLCHDFLSKFFCLTVAKKNVGTNRCIGKLRVSKKLFAKGDHYFLSKIFCLTGPKQFLREPFFL